ncbi:MAG: hypothetical protein JW828_06650 [Sedimentisphaerales bacterium]|nr:hypothetical protein [Sedimentisphaerales bacterium]
MTNHNEVIRQFVLLRHTRGDDIHWDFMIEQADHLATWRLLIDPREIADQPVPLEKIFDHPLRFLTYEGAVQKQTGSVTQSDQGIVHITQWEEKAIDFTAEGKLLKGSFYLHLIEGTLWQLEKKPMSDQSTNPE